MMPKQSSLSWFIAWRYFFAKKSTNAVHVISIVAVVGIALVALAMVVVLSVFNGFEELTNRQFSQLSPEFKIVHTSGGVFSASEVDIPGCSPVLSEQSVVTFEDNKGAVTLVGIDPTSYVEVVPIEDCLFDGAFEVGTVEVPTAVMGIGVATALGAGAGYQSPLEIVVPKRVGRISSINPARSFITNSAHISGVFRLDQPEDAEVVFLPLGMMRELLQYSSDEVSYLITNRDLSGLTQEQIQSKLGSDFRVLNRYEQHPEVYRVLRVEKWVSFLLLSFVLVLSLFSVISTLGMLIIEKRADTQLLSKLGARQSLVDNIIITESWLLSISGLVLGLIVGVILVLLQQHFGIVKLSGGDLGGMIIDTYPVRLLWIDLIWVCLVILGVGWVSSRIAYHLFMARHRVR